MKPLSVEMACLLGIQNEIQAVCWVSTLSEIEKYFQGKSEYIKQFPG